MRVEKSNPNPSSPEIKSEFNRRLVCAMTTLVTGHISAVEITPHRGASLDAPENTVAAMRLDFEQAADAGELDIYLTKDLRIVVLHDRDTARVTGVTNIMGSSMDSCVVPLGCVHVADSREDAGRCAIVPGDEDLGKADCSMECIWACLMRRPAVHQAMKAVPVIESSQSASEHHESTDDPFCGKSRRPWRKNSSKRPCW
jgi:glycerophosphoryl diester phosphodiesterase